MSNTTDALTYVAEGAAAGAALGIVGAAFNNNPPLSSMGNGALVGASVVTLGGLAVGLLSEKNRDVGFETAGIGFGAFVLCAIAKGIAGAST